MAALTQLRAKSRYSEIKRCGSVKGVSFPAISSLTAGSVTTNTVSIPNTGVNDEVIVTLQTPTNGVIVDGYVSGTGVVTVRQTNVTPSTITTVAASIGQVRTFSSE